ncbi:MAG TPA: aconitate hydratase AcnA [Ktedonobacteraceae bacterium]|nr:aconitate hydratase AcnA [Ktedonobacteraceae bacterium]
MTAHTDVFGARAKLQGIPGNIIYYQLDALAQRGVTGIERLPYTVKIILENVLRHVGGGFVTEDEVLSLARWVPGRAAQSETEYPFMSARVLLQDFTGVPAVADLAAMRSAVARMGGNPQKINPLVPADLVIDHSVQVDMFGTTLAFARNVEREYERNSERYGLLRWGQQAFSNFRVVPPGTGIVHQVNLEYLASVVMTRVENGETIVYPDTLVGTDSHTTMINGLGVLGWGVGGIEAEAVLLGQPIYLLTPEVIGVRLTGALPEGSTATDLVLTVTQMLRKRGVVGKFVEFTGSGLSFLTLADRATISNMSPEYGATATIFPVDDETLRYLRGTGRDPNLVELVERYTKAQGLFRADDAPEPQFDELLELDLRAIEPSLAGPRRPQDRVAMQNLGKVFREVFADRFEPVKINNVTENALIRLGTESNDTGPDAVAEKEDADKAQSKGEANGHNGHLRDVLVTMGNSQSHMTDGSVAIAAITSCTNTSNPSVMVAAGLLAKHAVERGLSVSPTVKTSLAPGSRAVIDYLDKAELTPFLEALRFHLVGFGCTTCIAKGTPVLLANGTARRIEQMASTGGAALLAPTADGRLGTATQAEMMVQGERECVSLVLQDGRTLVCTPDHEILCTDGRWVRADQLVLGQDRVVVGLEAPLDEPGDDEGGYSLHVGNLTFTMDTPYERLRTLAFARLLGHLLSDGSISLLGQGRMHVGQAMDREAVLDDVELLTGCCPVATRYDERKWTIVLPKPLTDAICTLPGVRIGRRIQQVPTLPAFVLDERCPVSVLREFLGGLFGADGHAPVLHRWGKSEEEATLETPSYSQSTIPEHVEALKQVMDDVTRLLARCGVKTNGANVYEYSTRRATSSYPAAQDGIPRVEVRLELPEGLSFVERVGFRYCMDKALRASAAAVYWRLVDQIHRQRLWMSKRLEELHQADYELSFSHARKKAAVELVEREAVVFPHYALLAGHDRFSRLPQATARKFQPLHRNSCDFPSPVELFSKIGAREWFAPLRSRADAETAKRYCIEKEALTLPTLALHVVERRLAGRRAVFDLAVNDLHTFVAGTIAVHNCIGNSGPLSDPVAEAVQDNDLIVAAVLSGNRNFEGRIHPQVRASFLASPPLVVAYALAGTVDIDLTKDPIGDDINGEAVYLRDIWPTQQEVRDLVAKSITPELFEENYAHVFEGDEHWRSLPNTEGELFNWNPDSTYIQEPPFFHDMPPEPEGMKDIHGARVLALMDDSITTDHISPAGNFGPTSPAGKYLIEHGVERRDFNTYGARRGNHEVMARGTFGNIRLRNRLVPGKEGYYTIHLPDGEETTIYDASVRYQQEGVPLIVIAGKEYGSGSSRDWAAKGPLLLGIRAAIAESFERIHRSNLVGMGILPLQFKPGETKESLGLTGKEVYDIVGIESGLKPRQEVTVKVTREDGSTFSFQTIARLDSAIDVTYYENGGILLTVLRRLMKE